jgi:hypothetical protein
MNNSLSYFDFDSTLQATYILWNVFFLILKRGGHAKNFVKEVGGKRKRTRREKTRDIRTPPHMLLGVANRRLKELTERKKKTSPAYRDDPFFFLVWWWWWWL